MGYGSCCIMSPEKLAATEDVIGAVFVCVDGDETVCVDSDGG